MQALRYVSHPGDPLEPRILTSSGAAAREFHVQLPAGEDLFHALCTMLSAHGVMTAGVRIISGEFEKFSFCTGVPDPTGYRVATFSEEKFPPCPAHLVAGNIIVGLDEDGALKTHCHAVFTDRNRDQHAGHLLPGACILGPDGASLWVTGAHEPCLQVQFDRETNFPIFHPVSRSCAPEKQADKTMIDTVVEEGRFSRTLTARIRPNTDLVSGIEELCVANKITHAEIRGCVGSLMDAVLALGSGDSVKLCEVEGPGLEIAVSSGVVRPDEMGTPRATLRGIVATGNGQAFAGEFVRERNLVFVTLEVVLQEWLPDTEL